MRVPLKFLRFGFWLISFKFAQCKECRRDDIKYENTDQLIEKASYADGELLKVNCRTGYTGLYKLKCDKGEWKKSIERPCAKKKCNHPGDIPHGDFKLMEGTEFVFGATVVYTCKKGYEMTSRITQRTCRAQGWDNAVPECEVVKCPAIYTDRDVTASGDTEEGLYGDVIHFECVSSEKMIDGSSKIHCEETGQWSDVVPKCKDITCTAPVISNGNVEEPQSEYQKDARLKYRCNKGFKVREGTPRCAKFGWTITPECDEVTCELKSTTFGVQKINPEGKTIFRAGESVEITCSETHWISNTKETSRSFTCQYSGTWNYQPVCEEITCGVPRNQHVSGQHFWETKKFGEKQSYSCNYGYRETAEVATCTRDGWTPKPLCTEVTCELKSTTFGVQKINPEGKTIFRVGESVEITCSETHWISNTKETSRYFTCQYSGMWNYQPVCEEITCGVPRNQHVSGQHFWGTKKFGEKQSYSCNYGYRETAEVATCTRDGWTPKPLCTEITCELKSTIFGVHKIKPKGRTFFRVGESVEITCSEKYWFIFASKNTKQFTCQTNGQWDYEPVCKEITCGDPHDQHVSVPHWKKMKLGANKSYRCEYGYRQTAEEATCTRDGWTPKPLCAEITCKDPHDQHVSRPRWGNLELGTKRNYSCESGYFKTAEEATCTRDGWTPKLLCAEITCKDPHDQHVSEPRWGNLELETKKNYSCEPGYNKTAEVATCTRDGWTPKLLCVGSVKCGSPPHIDTTDTVEMRKNEYNSGERVEYTCSLKYKLDPGFSKYLTCEEGEWKGYIKCLKPCIVTVEEMDKRGIGLKWRKNSHITSEHNDVIEFECQSGKTAANNNNALRQTCDDGVMSLPECVRQFLHK